MTRNEICQYVEAQLLQKHMQSLIQLYKLPKEQLRAAERSKLIELAAKIEWDAQELVLSTLKNNAVKNPHTVWMRTKEKIALLSYEYIQWADVPNRNVPEDVSYKGKFKQVAQEKLHAFPRRENPNNVKILEAKEKNIQHMVRWCKSLRLLLEQELQDR